MARRDGPRQRLGHHQDCLLGCRSASGSDRLFGRRRIWGQAVLCAGWQRVPAEARLLMSAMQRRVAAAQATRDRFYGKPFKFGRTDCGQMIKWPLRKIGCPLKIATQAGTYHSLLGAKKALAQPGYTDLIALMAENFEQIGRPTWRAGVCKNGLTWVSGDK